MKKLLFLSTLLFLAFMSTSAQAEEKTNKTAIVSIQDESGNYLDLTNAVIHLKINGVNVQWGNGRFTRWYYDNTNLAVVDQGIEITTPTDEQLFIDIYLDNGVGYYISEKLDFNKLNNIRLIIKTKELKSVDLSVSYPKNISVGYDISTPEFFDRVEGQYVIDTNHTKRLYTNKSAINMILNVYDDGKYYYHKEDIAVNNNMTKNININKADTFKQTITYSDYYKNFDYIQLALYGDVIPGAWFERHDGPLVIYSNKSLVNSSSIRFSSIKGDIYDISRNIQIVKANMLIGDSFIIDALEMTYNYDGSKNIHLSVKDEYNNGVRFIDINRNNDFNYCFYTMEGKTVKTGQGSLYWSSLDNEITTGKYMVKFELNSQLFSSNKTSYFLLEIINNKKWKITNEDGNFTLTNYESGAGIIQTGKSSKPNFSLISNIKLDLSAIPNTTTTTTSTNTSTNTIPSDGTKPSGTNTEVKDLKTSDWFYKDVAFLLDKGVINGYSDSTFRPNDQVKVDAFIKMIITSLGYKLTNGSPYWAQTYIDKAIEIGLIQSGDFDSYQRSITRGEMARIAANTLNRIENTQAYQYYEYQIMDFDVIDPTLKKPVMIAMSKGIITGYEDYTFRASNLANRAQAATIIARIIDSTKRKQVNYFEDQKKILLAKSDKLKTYMNKYPAQVDEAIDYLLGYGYEFKPFESREELRTLFIQKLTDFEAKLSQQVPISYGEAKTLSIELEGKKCEITIEPTVIRAKWVVSNSVTLFYEKNANGSGFFMRDTVRNRDYGFAYDVVSDELRIDCTLPNSMIGVGYYIYKIDEKYVAQMKEFETVNESKYVIFTEKYTNYSDEKDQCSVYTYPDNSYDIYLYEDYKKGNGIGLVQGSKKYLYIGEVNNFEFDGAGYEINEDGTTFIGLHEDMYLKGRGTMFCINGLVIEDTFNSYVAHSIYDSKYYMLKPDAPSIEKKIDEIITTQIKPNMSKDEKIQAIHDYLILNITYDKTNLDNPLEYFNINNAYAGIINKSTICLGYAQSMNLILNQLGIESYVVIGDTDQDKIGDHAWNYVKFSDGFYHVDVTWDDSDVGQDIYYDYFKVSDSEMRSTRGIEDIIGYDN